MRYLYLSLCGILALSSPARAQSNDWQYTASLYGWFTGLDSSVDTPLGTVSTNLSFSDILDDLEFAFFGDFEARHGNWAFIGDLNYSDLGAKRDSPFGIAFADVKIDTTLTIMSAYAAYSVINSPELRLDLAGGLRYYDLEADTRLIGNPPVANASFASEDNWVDPVIALRLRAPLSQTWFVNGFADVGGFGIGDGSDLSWQAYMGVGYKINDRWSMQLGYRYLSIDKEINNNDVELDLSGVLFGASYTF